MADTRPRTWLSPSWAMQHTEQSPGETWTVAPSVPSILPCGHLREASLCVYSWTVLTKT